MWVVEIKKITPPVPMKYSMKWCMHTFINLMEDANFLIKDRSTSPSYTEYIHTVISMFPSLGLKHLYYNTVWGQQAQLPSVIEPCMILQMLQSRDIIFPEIQYGNLRYVFHSRCFKESGVWECYRQVKTFFFFLTLISLPKSKSQPWILLTLYRALLAVFPFFQCLYYT